MDIFGNPISKCNKLSENVRLIKAIEVHYLIYSETPYNIFTEVDGHNFAYHNES